MKPPGAPDTVRVGAMDYKIDWVDSTCSFGADRYGECCYTELIIRLNGQLSSQLLAQSFIHEIHHAGWDAMEYTIDSEPRFKSEDVAVFRRQFLADVLARQLGGAEVVGATTGKGGRRCP